MQNDIDRKPTRGKIKLASKSKLSDYMEDDKDLNQLNLGQNKEN